MSEDRYCERIEYDMNDGHYIRLIYDKVNKVWEIHPIITDKEEEE